MSDNSGVSTVEETVRKANFSSQSRKTILQQLSDGALIERLGSFQPSFRKGYGSGKPEQRIRKHAARDIYTKRIALAKRIIESDESKSRQEILVESLVKEKLSPVTYSEWMKYVDFLAEREGGWEQFKKALDFEFTTIDQRRKLARNTCVFGGLAFLLVMVIFQLAPFPDVVLTIASGVILGAGAIFGYFFAYPKVNDWRKARDNFAGPNSKKTDDFIKGDHIAGL